MKIDNMDHPVSQNAARVGFACVLGFGGLAIADAMRQQSTRSTMTWIIAVVLAVLFGCSIATYFRPRGIAAFITSTAYVGVFMIGGVMAAGSLLTHLSGAWASVLGAAVLVGWVVLGIVRSVQAHRRARGQGRV